LQLVKKFPAFHETRKFITALTSVRHLSLSWVSPIQSTYPHPISCRSILILCTHLGLGLPSGSFPPVSPPRPCTLPSPHPYAPPTPTIPLDRRHTELTVKPKERGGVGYFVPDVPSPIALNSQTKMSHNTSQQYSSIHSTATPSYLQNNTRGNKISRPFQKQVVSK